MRFFCSRFLHLLNTYRPNNKASEFFSIFFMNLPTYSNFLTFGGDSVGAESHPRQLSQRQVRLHVNWVNAEWDSMSTESTQNDKIFVNVGVFCVDSVDVESHSALTILMWSLAPRWLSWRRVWLRIDSVWGRWIKPKKAYISSSGAFKGIVFIKVYEMFKWGPYQPENVHSFYMAWSKKLTNNSNISANSILYSKRI